MLRKIKEYFSNFKKYNKKIGLGIFCILALVLSYIVLNYTELISVYSYEKKISDKVENMSILLGGDAVGIKLLATGVLVMGIDREDTSLEIGDIILRVNDQKVESNMELLEFAKNSHGSELNLHINRQGKEFDTSIVPIKGNLSNEYKLGLWVKDSSAGVGTITFYEGNSKKFAALGHGVTETKENYILPITTGGLTKTSIYSIKKGESKSPGELKGSITNDILGSIEKNTGKGIYGTMYNDDIMNTKKKVDILPKSKIKEGEASIFCTIDSNNIKEYKINIEKVLLTSTGNKNMIIKVIDKELINKTGGIIQGMSGSPIVQDGKLVGAVTHVFLNDPTRGYGVFIENMIGDMLEYNI